MQSGETGGTKRQKPELTALDYLRQVVRGVAVSLGLLLLWSMEAVRDRFFRLIDRLGVPARSRSKGSPFPPGPAPGTRR